MGISSALGSSALLPAGLGFRNEIINGSFQVDQRNAGASQTITAGAALAYTADRWYAYCTGANVTGQRIAGAAPFQNYYRFTGAASNTAVGFGQRIEAANSFNCAGQTAYLSAYIASTSLTSITWTLYYANTTDTFGTLASPTRTQIATGTFTINSTLSRYQVQIAVPAAATTGLELVFTTGALLGSQTLTFAGVQLEQNYQPTPFEQRPIGVELALCQRYYYRRNFTVTGEPISTLHCYSTTAAYGPILDFPVVMRAVPTVGFSARSDFLVTSAAASSTYTWASGNLGASTKTCYNGGVQFTSAAFTAGHATIFQSANGNAWLDFAIEL